MKLFKLLGYLTVAGVIAYLAIQAKQSIQTQQLKRQQELSKY
jgi:hypothetical protein